MNDLTTLLDQQSALCECQRPIYKNSDKCIFHCDKTNWYTIENDIKIWDDDKIVEFENALNVELTKNRMEHDLSRTIFPKFIDSPSLMELLDANYQCISLRRPINFTNTVFLDVMNFNHFHFHGVNFSDAVFESDVNFSNCKFESELDYEIRSETGWEVIDTLVTIAPLETFFNNTSFKGDVRFTDSIFTTSVTFEDATIEKKADFTDAIFQDKTIFYSLNRKSNINKSEIIFENTKFMKLADFWNASFSEVSFLKTDFEAIAVFTNARFSKYFEFKYTKFDKQLIFNETEIQDGFELCEALFNADNIIYSNVVFSGEAKKRETYRLIKFVLDRRSNFIDGDEYYAREMKAYRKESFDKNLWNWVLLAFGKIISNYGNSWVWPLFWGTTISLGIFFYIYLHTCTSLTFFSLEWLKGINFYIYPSFIDILGSKEFTNFLNPFSKTLEGENSFFADYYWAWLSQKIISAIAIYHLIIASTRKTRRS